MERQIKEMACSICVVRHNCCDPDKPIPSCYAFKCAEKGFENGYRKASELAAEIFEEIEKYLAKDGDIRVITENKFYEIKRKFMKE